MGISKTYDFLTRTFAAHERKQLSAGLKGMGTTVSKAEGKKLGANADTFADFYANHRAPGKAVTTSELRQFASARFEDQMKALEASLSKGPGVDGFKLAKDVVDNWQAFVSKAELFKFAELPGVHKAAIMANQYWMHDQIPEPPAAASIERAKIAESKLPAPIKSFIAAQEAKHFVSADPAVTPPSASDIFQLELTTANQVKVDGVVVGYTLHFKGADTVTVDVEGRFIHKGELGLFEVTPSAAVGFSTLTAEQKIERLQNEELDSDSSQDWGSKSMAQALSLLGSALPAATIAAKNTEGLESVASSLDSGIYFGSGMTLGGMGVNITPELLTQLGSYDALIAHIKEKAIAEHGPSAADDVDDAMGNGGADVSGPQIDVYKEDGQIVGARFRWSVAVDGDHDYWTDLFYDHTTNKFIGGASGGYETDTDTWVD